MRNWSELIPDALELIFKNLSAEEKLTVVPSVCKSWGKAVRSSICWQEIDIEQLSKNCTQQQLDRLVRMLIVRSDGSLHKLAVTGLCSDALFSFIADNASSLKTLIIPRSCISDATVEQTAVHFANITTLDLSFCAKISPKALEAFGNNCKYLSVLRLSVHPLFGLYIKREAYAFAIASTMPNLRHLELSNCQRLTNVGVCNILSKCKKLEFLDITGCVDVKLENGLLIEKYPNLKVFEFRECPTYHFIR